MLCVSVGVMGIICRLDLILVGVLEVVILLLVWGIGIKWRWGCEWVRDLVFELLRKLVWIYSG